MPQIFHPSFNTISRVSIFGAVFFIGLAIWVGAIIARSPYVTEETVVKTQPVPFSHQHHVGDVGIDCRYCHTSVEDSHFAGIPSTEICMNCHSHLWKEAEILQPVRGSWREDTPLQWTRVHDLPDYCYFNHSIHIHKGIGCTSCHGQVDEMPLMWKNASMHMEWCLDCHRNPVAHVRPRKEVYNMNWDPPRSNQPLPAEQAASYEVPAGTTWAELPDVLIEQYEIVQETNCSICHR